MKLSVVIPHHSGISGADRLLHDCINSLHGHDELIVYTNEGIGYGPAVNLGLELTTGDHIIVCNNDVLLKNGNLRELIVHNKITVPRFDPALKDEEPRAVFCIPKYLYLEIRERYGFFYDERFRIGYWEDDDLIKRIEEMGIETQFIENVVFHHVNGGGNTMKKMGEAEFYNENKGRFDEKWGD